MLLFTAYKLRLFMRVNYKWNGGLALLFCHWDTYNVPKFTNIITSCFAMFMTLVILGYPGVIPLATSTSTSGTISWFSFDVPLNEYYHFIGFILIFCWAGWPMKTILTKERLSDWTARYNASYRFSVADSKLFTPESTHPIFGQLTLYMK